jgi:hypothetical protein
MKRRFSVRLMPDPVGGREAEILRSLIPFIHWQGGMRGKHNCDFEKCKIEPCPALRDALRSSGLAAQNQEGLCDAFLGCGDDEWAGTYCKLRKGHDGPHSAHYPAARSPQGEDHER